MKTFKKVTTQKVKEIVCDGCGLKAIADDDYEFNEFISINHHCGYGSIHGDGRLIDIDLCQQCFFDMCGDTFRVTEEKNNLTQENKSSDINQLEYSNIFEVICQSKEQAHKLKESSDLSLIVRDILTKNEISNQSELTIALKRVEQLWGAQYKSEEGMLSSMPININIDDANSRDLTLVDSNLDDSKQHLLESIAFAMVKHPELRFGQLLINAMNLQQPYPELYYAEDDLLIEKFSQLLLK